MTFTTQDALFLQAVHHLSRSGKGASRKDVIEYVDYLDHIVLTPEEFEGSKNKLIEAGLIADEGGALAARPAFRDWWKARFAGSKRIDSNKEFEAIKAYLTLL